MSRPTRPRPLPAAALSVASALALCGALDRPAAAQTGITGSLPDSHPMKDGGTGEGAFGATGSFTRGGSLGSGGAFGRLPRTGGVGFNYGGFRPGFGYGYGGLGYNRLGYGGWGYNGFGYGGLYGPVFQPVVGLNQGGAYVVPGPLVGYNFGPVAAPAWTVGSAPPGFAFGGGAANFGGGAFVGPATVPAIGPIGPVGAGPNPALDEAWREEADRWRAPIDLGDAGALPNAPRPPDERELADALRDERAGDLAFGRLEYRKALSLYARAASAAPTRGEPLYRSAFARVALGQFAAAGDDLRRAVGLNPSLPVSGPTLRELYGPDHSIARTAALGGVAEHARQDVRDPDRLFLLGATMHANGDDRAREIFEAAWRLTGGRPHLRPYLDPPRVNFEAAEAAPADAAPAAADPIPADLSAPTVGGPAA